uniref:PBPe domain-containing protein n=1 Tax=Elaeophora elaphi TaxID=1147741 RepID=A0A0R3RMR1_9BILA
QKQQQQDQHYLDPLQEIVEAENVNFENGYSLKVVVENLLDRFEAILSQEYSLPRARSHIPDWAMIVFIVCALLCLLMTIGLCLMQTSVRRGSPRSKPVDTTRRWKAGFVGGMWYDV